MQVNKSNLKSVEEFKQMFKDQKQELLDFRTRVGSYSVIIACCPS